MNIKTASKKLNIDELIKSNEKILLQELRKTLKTGKSYEFAVGYTNDLYYGKKDSSNEKYVGGQANMRASRAEL